MLHQPSSPKSGRVCHEDRKEQLLDVATHLFAKYGLEGTTTKDIAKAAGVSPGLLYHYYASKEELLLSVVKRFSESESFSQRLQSYFELPVEDGLARIVTELGEGMRRNKEVFWIIMRAAAIFPTVGQTLREQRSQDRSGLVRYFETKMDQGELRPLDPQATASLLIHVVMMNYITEEESDFKVEEFVDSLLYGIKKRD